MAGTASEREKRDRNIYLLHLGGDKKTSLAREFGLERRQIARIIEKKERERQADKELVKSAPEIPEGLSPRSRAVKSINDVRNVWAAQQRLIVSELRLALQPRFVTLLHDKMVELHLKSLEENVLQLFEEPEQPEK